MDGALTSTTDELLSFKAARGRWVLVATVLGSGLASLDATVVNIALPAIGRDLGGGVAALQWTVDGYALTLAALMLVGGALGDRHGRKRVFTLGVVWFTLASLACGLAPSRWLLVAARTLQGVGGALLMPGSLAILEASFREEDRATAIGAWSALGGVAVALGPFVGGYLVEAGSWRLVFFINVPLALATLFITRRFVPETRDETAAPRVDFAGAALAALALGGVTYALIESGARGLGARDVEVAGAVGVATLIAFLVVERRSAAPMLELALFRSRQFSAANAATLLVYAALSGALFLLPLELQQQLGYSPVLAGAALLPPTAMMLLLSSTMGRLSYRYGPRLFLTVGPLVIGGGLLMLRQAGRSYVATVLPGAIVFGLGLSINVAPLTATVMSAAPAAKAGIASAINNCVARTGGLLAVALLPTLAGAGHAGSFDPALFRRGVAIAAAMCIVGAALAFAGIRNPPRRSA